MHTEPTTPGSEATTSPLGSLQTLEAFQQQHAHIFPALESVRWYVRQHRQGLLDCGALLMIAGRLWVNPEPFAEYVVKAGKAAAKQRAGVPA